MRRSKTFRPRLESLEDRSVPATFTAGSVSELVAAVAAANQAPEADVISLTPGATYTLTAPGENDGANSTALPSIKAAGGPLTIDGNGATLERSTAPVTPYFRLLAVDQGATLRVEDLTVQGGHVPFSSGGGILNLGTLVLVGVTVQNNRAGGGYGDRGGGGIYSSGSLTVQGGAIRDNWAVGSTGSSVAAGGGVYVAGGTADLNSVVVTGNVAQGATGQAGQAGGTARGGGLYVAYGTVQLRNVSVTENRAVGGAGGSGYSYWVYDDHDARKKYRVVVPAGPDGEGIGGGLYIESGAVTLDAFTVANIKRNTASTGRNIFGPYTTVS